MCVCVYEYICIYIHIYICIYISLICAHVKFTCLLIITQLFPFKISPLPYLIAFFLFWTKSKKVIFPPFKDSFREWLSLESDYFLSCFPVVKYRAMKFQIFLMSPYFPVIHAWMRTQLLCSIGLFCNPMDCSLPGSSVHAIFQARIWVSCHFLLHQ